MSTTFVNEATGEVAFIRWGKKSSLDRVAFEFGSLRNLMQQVGWANNGATFGPVDNGWQGLEAGDITAAWLIRLLITKQATFGEFGGTWEMGAGEMLRFHDDLANTFVRPDDMEGE